MKLQITIDCANDAFVEHDCPELECVSILDDCMTSLRSRGIEDLILQDRNGNTVGKMVRIDK